MEKSEGEVTGVCTAGNAIGRIICAVASYLNISIETGASAA